MRIPPGSAGLSGRAATEAAVTADVGARYCGELSFHPYLAELRNILACSRPASATALALPRPLKARDCRSSTERTARAGPARRRPGKSSRPAPVRTGSMTNPLSARPRVGTTRLSDRATPQASVALAIVRPTYRGNREAGRGARSSPGGNRSRFKDYQCINSNKRIINRIRVNQDGSIRSSALIFTNRKGKGT